MQEQGLESSLVPLDELSVMGAGEVLPALPRLWVSRRRHSPAPVPPPNGRLRGTNPSTQLAKRRLVEHIRSEKPDVVLTVDAKGFVSRVARDLSACKSPCATAGQWCALMTGKRLRGVAMGTAQPPVVHVVAPTFWARSRPPAEAGGSLPFAPCG